MGLTFAIASRQLGGGDRAPCLKVAVATRVQFVLRNARSFPKFCTVWRFRNVAGFEARVRSALTLKEKTQLFDRDGDGLDRTPNIPSLSGVTRSEFPTLQAALGPYSKVGIGVYGAAARVSFVLFDILMF